MQWFYFLAIHRLAIGVALLIEYLAPLLVALWARFAYNETVRRRIWARSGSRSTGLALIVNVFGGGTSLSTAGVLFALGGAFAYALYVLLAEHVVGSRDPVSLLAWGFLFTSVFWAVLVPWWTFPAHALTATTSLHGHLHAWHLPVWVLAAWMIVLGTIAPFFLLVSALRHLSATRVGIVAMLEPVAGALVAWAWLSESLGGVQLAGAGGRAGGDRAGADRQISGFRADSHAENPPFGGGFKRRSLQALPRCSDALVAACAALAARPARRPPLGDLDAAPNRRCSAR